MNDSHDTFDPIALLDSIAPPPGWNERTDLDADPRAATIFDRVVSGNVVPFHKPRRRLRIVTSVVIGVTLGGAAVAALWDRSPDDARSLTCWSAQDAEPDTRIAVEWDGLTDPIGTCVEAWSASELGAFGPPDEVRVCVDESGLAAAIRGADDQTCDLLGLSAYVPLSPFDENDDTLAVATAQRELDMRFNADQCVTQDEAVTGTLAILAEFELKGWTIEIRRDFTERENCATVALEDFHKIAIVIPVGRSQTTQEFEPEAVERAREAIRALFPDGQCATVEEAGVGTRNILDEFGLYGWAVKVDGADSADEQCAAVSLDAANEAAIVSLSGLAD